jgi:hypothetical protein
MDYIRILLIALSVAMTTTSHAESRVVHDVDVSAQWIAKALTSSGYEADFSLTSLREIDRFFDEQAPMGKPKPGGLLSEDLGERLFAIGCYVGEVIRGESGGVWQGNDDDPRAEVNLALKLPNGTVMWPVQRAIKRFKLGPGEGIYAYGLGATSPSQ